MTVTSIKLSKRTVTALEEERARLRARTFDQVLAEVRAERRARRAQVIAKMLKGKI